MGLMPKREANDIVRVFRLGKTDTVMSCLGDRFQDARVLINTMASSSGPITCRTCSQDIVHVQSALDELPKRFRPNVKVEYGHVGMRLQDCCHKTCGNNKDMVCVAMST